MVPRLIFGLILIACGVGVGYFAFNVLAFAALLGGGIFQGMGILHILLAAFLIGLGIYFFVRTERR